VTKEIIRMAKEAFGRVAADWWFDAHAADLVRFAALVTAAERERCAKVCEDQVSGSDYHYLAIHGHWDHRAMAVTICAAAIRALP